MRRQRTGRDGARTCHFKSHNIASSQSASPAGVCFWGHWGFPYLWCEEVGHWRRKAKPLESGSSWGLTSCWLPTFRRQTRLTENLHVHFFEEKEGLEDSKCGSRKKVVPIYHQWRKSTNKQTTKIPLCALQGAQDVLALPRSAWTNISDRCLYKAIRME